MYPRCIETDQTHGRVIANNASCASNAVTEDKVMPTAITTEKIRDGAVTSAKVQVLWPHVARANAE